MSLFAPYIQQGQHNANQIMEQVRKDLLQMNETEKAAYIEELKHRIKKLK